MDISFAVITCSDTRDLTRDEAGAALERLVLEAGWSVASHVVVKDEQEQCGGTGLSLRDVTPEATRSVCDRDVPGIAEAMRAYSMTKTRRAMLSRAVCMQRGRHLVINFPGSTKAALECWEGISDQFEHACKMTAGGGH